MSAALSLYHVRLGAFDKGDYLTTLKRRNAEVVQSRIDMCHERGPVGLADSHAFVRCLHVTAGVIQGPSGALAQKVDKKLLLAADAIVASVRLKAPQKPVGHQPPNQVFGDGGDRVITAQPRI